MKVNKDGLLLDDAGKPLHKGGKPVYVPVPGTTTTTTSTTTTAGTTTTTTVGTSTSTTTSAPPTLGGSGKVTITATVDVADPGIHSDLAPFKWGKQGWYSYEVDDNFRYQNDMIAFIRGGGPTEILNGGGHTYTAKTFTDGCGNNIPYRMAWAFTEKLSGSPDTLWIGPTFNAPYLSDFLKRVQEGDAIEPHGSVYHDWNHPNVLSYEGGGWTMEKNVELGSQYIWQNLGFIPRIFITPNADAGYNQYLKVQGFLGNSSQNVTDGDPPTPNDADIWVNHLGRATDVQGGAFYAYLRTFLDAWNDTSQVSDLKSFIDNLLNLSSPTDIRFFRHGSHGFGDTQAHWDGWCDLWNHLEANNNDRVAVISTQEALEYFETKRLIVKSETVVGNKITIELDYNAIPDITNWRDISLYIRTTSNITNITVDGAQGSSHNNTTGLVNVYNKRNPAVGAPYYTPSTGKITLKTTDFYQDNTYDYKPDALINGVTAQNNWSASNNVNNHLYKPYILSLDLEDYEAVVDKVRLYNNQNTGSVCNIYAVKASDATRVFVGTNTTNASFGWREYTVPSQFKADRIEFEHVSGSSYGIGSQLEVISISHLQRPANPNIARKHYPIKNLLGFNAHGYNFLNNTDGNPATTVMAPRYAMIRDYMKPASIRYFDSAQGYQPVQDQWSFNPVRQGWQEETLANKLKVDLPGIEMWTSFLGQYLWMADLWHVPDVNNYVNCTVTGYTSNGGWGSLFLTANSAVTDGSASGFDQWFVTLNQAPPAGTVADDWKTETSNGKTFPTTFPSDFSLGVFPDIPAYASQIGMQVRVYAGHNSQFNIYPDKNTYAGRDDKATWAAVLGKAMFVLASRRGKNTNVPDYTPYAGNGNTMLKGTDTNTRGEPLNEPNAFWAGFDDFLNGRHLYQCWTVCYDGHLKTIPNCGVKQADPNFKMSTSGLATIDVDLMRGCYKMAKFERGKMPDGTYNMPFDDIQFHAYSYTGGISQYAGGVQGALPPEWGNILDGCDAFAEFSAKYAANRPCIVGEWGIDLNPNSVMSVAIYGAYSDDEVRGRWMLRTLIEFEAHGMKLSNWYRYQMDSPGDISNSTQFMTMDLVQQPSDFAAAPTRRITGDYFCQLHTFDDYVFDARINNEAPRVLRFKNPSTGAIIYFIWAKENPLNIAQWGSQKPAFSEITGTYNLALANGTTYRVHQFVAGNAVTTPGSILTVSGGNAPIAYGSKPVVVEIAPAP